MKKYFFLSIIILFTNEIYSDVRLASLFTDNLVLQRDKIISVWGKAGAGEIISVKIKDQSLNVEANEEGDWIVKLSPMPAGGPYELEVTGKNKIALKNIMIGEVWLCSGQSNMEFTLKKSEGGDEEISKADFPLIRIFIVKHKVADVPQGFCEGEWQICSPKTIGQFSGAAYFFAKNLFNEFGIPIGLIQSTWGGTPAEAWVAKQVLESDGDFAQIMKRWDKQMAEYPAALEEYKRNGQKLIDLWKIDSAAAAAKGMAPPRKPGKPEGPGTRNQPTGLYNGMIAPIIPFTIQGVIWYQGESNVSRAYQYRKLFPALITSWREKWNLGDFQFYFVQLPNLYRQPEPSKSGWAELREAQLMTLSLPNTGMAVTIDIGDPKNLHPTNKKDVGFRLALIAKAKVYGSQIEFSGPVYKIMKIEDDKIVLSFEHTGEKMFTKNSDRLAGFTISGSDKKFIEAKAKIDGNKIIVWNDAIKNPIAVRYAWADNPDCNLYNSADLPASPFRTDDWPETTYGRK